MYPLRYESHFEPKDLMAEDPSESQIEAIPDISQSQMDEFGDLAQSQSPMNGLPAFNDWIGSQFPDLAELTQASQADPGIEASSPKSMDVDSQDVDSQELRQYPPNWPTIRQHPEVPGLPNTFASPQL